MQEGALIGGRKVKTFTALTGVAGSSDQTRSFNARQQIVYRVSYVDGGLEIVRADIP